MEDDEQQSFYQTGATNRRQLFENNDFGIKDKNKQSDDLEITFDGMNFIDEDESNVRSPNKSSNSHPIPPDFTDETATMKLRPSNFGGQDGQFFMQMNQTRLSIFEHKNIGQGIQGSNLNNQKNLNLVWKKKFFSVFLILFNVIRFVKMVRSKMNPELFNRLAVEIIADKAFDKSILISEQYKNKTNNSKSVLNRKNCKCLNLIRVINTLSSIILKSLLIFRDKFNRFMIFLDEKVVPWDPLSTFIIFWERFQLICLIFEFFYVPFRVNVQNIQACEDFHDYIHLVFIADILVKMNTQFFYEGEIIKNHQDIFINYFKTALIPDFIAISVIVSPNLYFFSRQEFIFIILKMKSFLKIIDKIKENIFSVTKLELFNLFNLIVLDIFIGHLVACEWVALGIWEKQHKLDNWIELNHLNNDLIISLYIKSLYFCIVTMNTVGYGDFTPQTDLERAADMFIILVGCLLFGYSISKIGSILQSINKNREKLTQSMGGVNLYMKSNDLGLDLQNKVRKYLEYIHLKRDEEQQSNDFISLLSKNLQREIIIQVQGNALKSVDLLMKNFSSEFLEDLSLKVKQIYFCSDETILEEDSQVEDPSFYILNQGCIEISFRNTNCRVLKEKGEYFGQIEFFQMEKRNLYTIKSVGITSLFQIQLTDLMNLFQNYPSEKEIFYSISHGVKFHQRYQQIVSACRICCCTTHIEQNCNFIQYKPNIYKLVKSLHFTQPRDTAFIRHFQNKFNTLLNQKKVEDALYDTDNDEEQQTEEQYTAENLQDIQKELDNDYYNFNENTKNSMNEESKEYDTSSKESTIKSAHTKVNSINSVPLDDHQLGHIQQNFNYSSALPINKNKGEDKKQNIQLQLSKAQEIEPKKMNSRVRFPSDEDICQLENPKGQLSIASLNHKKLKLNQSKKATSSSMNEIIQQPDSEVNDAVTKHDNFNNQTKSTKIKGTNQQDIFSNKIGCKSINNIKECDISTNKNDQIKNCILHDISTVNTVQSSEAQDQNNNEQQQLVLQKDNNKYNHDNFRGASIASMGGGNAGGGGGGGMYSQFETKADILSCKQDQYDQKSLNIVMQDSKQIQKRRQSSFYHLDPITKQNQKGNDQSHHQLQRIKTLDGNSPNPIQQNDQLENQFESLKTQLLQYLHFNTPQLDQHTHKEGIISLSNHNTEQKHHVNKDIVMGGGFYSQKNIAREDNLLDDIGKDYKYYFTWNNKSHILSILSKKFMLINSIKPKIKQKLTQKYIKKLKK